jgi:tetraacyldisaccharide 4'-kinase
MSRPPHAPIPRPLGVLLEPLYRVAISRRNRAFDAGRRVTRLPVPVLSVGNLSVGGVGKTPTVMWLVRRLRELGRTPAVAMRGYGPKTDGLADEQAEYLDEFPGLPLAVGPERVRTIPALLRARPDVDAVILDDGFQHRSVHRDADLVLIDATRPFPDRLLPAGWFREPAASLARASAAILTHAEAVGDGAIEAIERRIRDVAPDLRVGVAEHAWTALGVSDPGGGDRDEPVEALAGRRVVATLGVGNPEPFLRRLTEAGAEVVAIERRRDHASWADAPSDHLARLAAPHAPVDLCVTTRKDWVKLRWRPELITLPVAHPALSLRFRRGLEDIARVVESAAGPPSPIP